MAKDKVVLTLELLNKFSGTLSEYEKALSQSQRATQTAGSNIAKSWQASMIAINQGAELAKKAFRGMQMGFDGARMAAGFKGQAQAFNQMAASMGADSNKIIVDMQAAAKGAISTQDAVAAGARSLALGLQPEKLADLMKIARSSAIQMGTDASTAFNDLTLAVGRQSKMILDNLGIIISQETANLNYSKAMKIVGRELTDAERKQAFLNEAIKVGTENMNKMGEVAKTDAEKLDELTVAVQEAKTEFFSFINDLGAIKFFQNLATAIGEATDMMEDFWRRSLNGVNVNEELDDVNHRIKTYTRLIKEQAEISNKGGFWSEGAKKNMAEYSAELEILIKRKDQLLAQMRTRSGMGGRLRMGALAGAADDMVDYMMSPPPPPEESEEARKAREKAAEAAKAAAEAAYKEELARFGRMADAMEEDYTEATEDMAWRASEIRQKASDEAYEKELAKFGRMADAMEEDYDESTQDMFFRAANIRKEVDKKSAEAYKKTWKGAWEDATKSYQEAARDWGTASRELFSTMSSNFENMFFNVFRGKMDSLKDFWKSMWEDMVTFALRWLAKLATAKILPQIAAGLGIPGIAGAAGIGAAGVGAASIGAGGVGASAVGTGSLSVGGGASMSAMASAAAPFVVAAIAGYIGFKLVGSLLGDHKSGQTKLLDDFSGRTGIKSGGHNIVAKQGVGAFFDSLTDEWKKMFAGPMRQGVMDEVLPEIAAVYGKDSDMANVIFEELEKWASDVGLAGDEFAKIMTDNALTFDQKMEALQLAAQGLAWTQEMAAKDIGDSMLGLARRFADFDPFGPPPPPPPGGPPPPGSGFGPTGGGSLRSVRAGGGGATIVNHIKVEGFMGDKRSVSREISAIVKDAVRTREVTFSH